MKRRTIAILLAMMMLAFLNVGYAQQTSSAYRFAPLIASGETIGGYTFNPQTSVGDVAISDSGAIAFTAHWLDNSSVEHTAVFTREQIVAQEGTATDAGLLVHIASAVAVSNTALVGYEATYADSVARGVIRTGVFVGQHLSAVLDNPSGTIADFTLTDDGRIIPGAGTVSPAPPPKPLGNNAAVPTQGAAGQKPDSDTPGLKVPKALGGILKKVQPYSPVQLPAAGQPISSPSGQPKTPPASVPPNAPAPKPLAAAARPVVCALPAFPTPQEWQIGADVSGGIVSHVFDPAINGRTYYSPFFGLIASPLRIVHFAADCKPVLITIADVSQRSRLEIWSPAGVVTWTRPDGSLELNGIAERVSPGNLLRLDSPIRINRRGQILMPVALSSGAALLLGNPEGGSR